MLFSLIMAIRKIVVSRYFLYGNAEKSGRAKYKPQKVKNIYSQSFFKRKPYMQIE